jgi:hypothetical protein
LTALEPSSRTRTGVGRQSLTTAASVVHHRDEPACRTSSSPLDRPTRSSRGSIS